VLAVTVPADQWEANAPAVVVSWLYKDGATVAEGQVIAEVMIEKAQFDILAPVGGILHHKVMADETFERGEPLAFIAAS
jgi:pyruvate/2-oxoglutarate dehydrogenase complex dihydrolipoamide acyltransferase (E2) component